MIKECRIENIDELINLAKFVYLNSSNVELKAEFQQLIEDKNSQIYLWIESNNLVGFAQFQIRYDYVEGIKRSPCGYLEGVFVKEEYRKKGIARALVEKGEEWSQNMNCYGFASDCEIDNHQSLLFHERIGFKEVSRNIHFVK